ncbi:MAG: decarboxylase [Candidatus Omnitrophota bacterium]
MKTPRMDKTQLRSFVERFLKDRKRYMDMQKEYGSPLYLFDEEALVRRAAQFQDAFRAQLPQSEFFYALKSNDHPFLLKTLVSCGYGMDVSSGRELLRALAQDPESIIFSGPGKTNEEFGLACGHAGRVIVLMDSFGEMRRLQEVAAAKKVCIRAGVRLMVEENGLWRKFGIPLRELAGFCEEARQLANIEFCGLQFHSSWNHSAHKQIDFLKKIGAILATLDGSILRQIRFVDIGGGYWPACGEWMQPSATPEGRLRQCIEPKLIEEMDHYCLPASAIEDFASQLAEAIRQNIFPHLDCAIHFEPGRWISHDAMHILLTVIDKKADDVVITDGGGNIIGWERFELDYFPVINLSRSGLEEHQCMVFGSLCTPHDLWGYSYFGTGIEAGDILLIPTQGAYTYSLRQEFIKSLPAEVVFTSSGSHQWKYQDRYGLINVAVPDIP